MPTPDPDWYPHLADRLGLDARPGRRRFLVAAAGSLAGLTAVGTLARTVAGLGLEIVEKADGLLVADPSRCVGCRRCELACTERLDGRSQPSMARIKVGRNHNFGPRGQQLGLGRGAGEFGNLRVIQDVCLQCPHPVPCSSACPNDAFALEPKTRARVINAERCDGCRRCLRACPWEMMSFDKALGKATKCTLCSGQPACVEACPASALQYVRWRDLTDAVPVRQATTAGPVYDQARCGGCHRPRR